MGDETVYFASYALHLFADEPLAASSDVFSRLLQHLSIQIGQKQQCLFFEVGSTEASMLHSFLDGHVRLEDPLQNQHTF